IATIIMSSIISILVSILVLVFGNFIMNLFTSAPDVIAIGKRFLLIVGAFYVVFSSMFISSGVLRGAGVTIIPMFITLFALWGVRIPLAYFLSGEIGIDGIWWAIPAGWFLGFTLSFSYYLSGRWKKKNII
ncbi:MAG: MATE family efflux transporter, partial [Bacteroidota bacterium]|nr:MATE family efflux transporter [Bacteroidota bacterium]